MASINRLLTDEWRRNQEIAKFRIKLDKKIKLESQRRILIKTNSISQTERAETIHNLETFETKTLNSISQETKKLAEFTNSKCNGCNNVNSHQRRLEYLSKSQAVLISMYSESLNDRISSNILNLSQFEICRKQHKASVESTFQTIVKNRRKSTAVLAYLASQIRIRKRENVKQLSLKNELCKRDSLLSLQAKVNDSVVSSRIKFQDQVISEVVNTVSRDIISAIQWQDGVQMQSQLMETSTQTSLNDDTKLFYLAKAFPILPFVEKHSALSDVTLSPLHVVSATCWSNFVNKISRFNTHVTSKTISDAEIVVNRDDDTTIESITSLPSHNLLGETIVKLRHQSSKAVQTNLSIRCVPGEERHPFPPLRMIIFEGEASKSHTLKIAQLIQDKVTSLKILSVKELVRKTVESTLSYQRTTSYEFTPNANTDNLSDLLVACIQSNLPIPNSLIIELIQRCIKNIPRSSVGYIIIDYPSTYDCARELMIATSGGVDFEVKQLSINKYSSAYAQPITRDNIEHDSQLCGFTDILYLEEEPEINVRNSQKILKAFLEKFDCYRQFVLNGNGHEATMQNVYDAIAEAVVPAHLHFSVLNGTGCTDVSDCQRITEPNDNFKLSNEGTSSDTDTASSATTTTALTSSNKSNELICDTKELGKISADIADAADVALSTENSEQLNLIATGIRKTQAQILNHSLATLDNSSTMLTAMPLAKSTRASRIEPSSKRAVPGKHTATDAATAIPTTSDGVISANPTPLPTTSITTSNASNHTGMHSYFNTIAVTLSSCLEFPENLCTKLGVNLFEKLTYSRYALLSKRQLVLSDTKESLQTLSSKWDSTFNDFRQLYNSYEFDCRSNQECIFDLNNQLTAAISLCYETKNSTYIQLLQQLNDRENDCTIITSIHDIYSSALQYMQSAYLRYLTYSNILIDYMRTIDAYQHRTEENAIKLQALSQSITISYNLESAEQSLAKKLNLLQGKRINDKSTTISKGGKQAAVLISDGIITNTTKMCCKIPVEDIRDNLEMVMKEANQIATATFVPTVVTLSHVLARNGSSATLPGASQIVQTGRAGSLSNSSSSASIAVVKKTASEKERPRKQSITSASAKSTINATHPVNETRAASFIKDVMLTMKSTIESKAKAYSRDLPKVRSASTACIGNANATPASGNLLAEPLAAALERAMLFETDRLSHELTQVYEAVNAHTQWILTLESSYYSNLRQTIETYLERRMNDITRLNTDLHVLIEHGCRPIEYHLLLSTEFEPLLSSKTNNF